MKKRLNITIDDKLLEKVKRYAASHKSSVSELVESYFRTFAETSTHTRLVEMIEQLPTPTLTFPDDLKKKYMEENAGKYGF